MFSRVAGFSVSESESESESEFDESEFSTSKFSLDDFFLFPFSSNKNRLFLNLNKNFFTMTGLRFQFGFFKVFCDGIQ